MMKILKFLRKNRKEITKQLIDQPAHFLWSFTVFIIGWNVAPLGYIFIAMHYSAIVAREAMQWPSSRWYDPWLDWSVFLLGFVSAYYYCTS